MHKSGKATKIVEEVVYMRSYNGGPDLLMEHDYAPIPRYMLIF